MKYSRIITGSGLAMLVASHGAFSAEVSSRSGDLENYLSSNFNKPRDARQWSYSGVEVRAYSDADDWWNQNRNYRNRNDQINVKKGAHAFQLRFRGEDTDCDSTDFACELDDETKHERRVGEEKLGWYDLNYSKATYRYQTNKGLNLIANLDTRGQYSGSMNYRYNLSEKWRFTGYADSDTEQSYSELQFRPNNKMDLKGKWRVDGDMYGLVTYRPWAGWRLRGDWRSLDDNTKQGYGANLLYARGIARYFKPTLGVNFGQYQYNDTNADYYNYRHLWFKVSSELFDSSLDLSAKYTLRQRDYVTADAGASNFGREDMDHVFTLSSWYYPSNNFGWGLELDLSKRDSTQENRDGRYYDLWFELEKRF